MKDIRHYLYESEEEYPFESMEEILAVNAAKQELCESSTSKRAKNFRIALNLLQMLLPVFSYP